MLAFQSFARYVVTESENLMNDINYFERKIHLLQPGEDQMMFFFNYSERYAKLKAETSLLTDTNISRYWLKIRQYANQYDLGIRQAFKHAYNLYKLNLEFAAKIKFLSSEATKGIQGAISKFEEVLSLSAALITKRAMIEDAIGQLKKMLSEFQILQYQTDSDLMSISQALNEIKFEFMK